MSNPFSMEHKAWASEGLFTVNSSLERRKIVVFGTFGAGNIGNECTLQAMLYNIRRHLPSAELLCICSDPEEAAADYGVPAYPIRSVVPVDRLFGGHARSDSTLVKCLRKMVRVSLEPYRWYKAFTTLRGKNILFITGLGMLGDVGISAFGLHYDILGWSIVAKICRCKLKFVSVGVGPIRDPVSRWFVKAALALGDYRSYRDNFSKEYLESIGFSTAGDRVYPDLAFSFPKRSLPAIQTCGHHKRVIGVGLMEYYDKRGRSGDGGRIYRKYIGSIADLTSMLIDHDYTVRLLIGDTRYDQGVRHDLRALLRARGQKSADARLVDEPASSVAELLSQLAATDLVVASRFHNVLLAIMLRKPVVALSYHEKVISLMNEFGLSKFCHNIEDFDATKVIRQVRTLERGTGSVKVKVQTLMEHRSEYYRKVLDEQYELIFRPVQTCVLQKGVEREVMSAS